MTAREAPRPSFLVATFSVYRDGNRTSINGNVEPLLDFLRPRTARAVLVDQPHPGSDRILPVVERYVEGQPVHSRQLSFIVSALLPVLRKRNTSATHVSFKVRDFLSVVEVGVREREGFDYVIGLEAVNAIAGIFLRRLRKVKRVIYYVSDYSPFRYKNTLFNRLYLALDRFAAMHADYIWNVSDAMQPARVAAGLRASKSAPAYHVPNALYPYQIQQVPIDEVVPDSLVFMGTLGFENGPDLAIEALPLVRAEVPGTILHIIGGGDADLARLRALAARLSVQEVVVFHGLIADRRELSRAIRQFQVALAPYRNLKHSIRLYADATKIRAFAGAGMAIITTPVPPLGRSVAAAGAALVVADNKEEIARVILRVLKKPDLCGSLRDNAFAFARANTWDKEFASAFRRMGLGETMDCSAEW